jgi:isoquinoline 1-oxidoreductase alpha subunit
MHVENELYFFLQLPVLPPDQTSGNKPLRQQRKFLASGTAALSLFAACPQPTYLREHEMVTLNINGRDTQVDVDPSTPILWTLRDSLQMTGTKFGCGAALCGACTVHLNGQPIRSCVTPISAAVGQKITTIEAMSADTVGKAVQDAWVKNDVPQCGYCQSGQVMSATALLKANKSPSDKDIDDAMSGNICRCGTYQRIRAAIKDASKALA